MLVDEVFFKFRAGPKHIQMKFQLVLRVLLWLHLCIIIIVVLVFFLIVVDQQSS